MDYLKTERKPGHKRTRFDVPQEYIPGIISAKNINPKQFTTLGAQTIMAHGNDSEAASNQHIVNTTTQSKNTPMPPLDRISEKLSSVGMATVVPKMSHLKMPKKSSPSPLMKSKKKSFKALPSLYGNQPSQASAKKFKNLPSIKKFQA